MWCHCVTARLTAAHTPDHRTAFKCEAEITTWWILCERKWNVSGVHECTWCKIMMKTCLDSVSVSFQKENKPKTQHCKSSFRRYWRQVFGWSLFYFLPLTTQLRRRAAAVSLLTSFYTEVSSPHAACRSKMWSPYQLLLCGWSHMRGGGCGRYLDGDLSRQKTHWVSSSEVSSLDTGNGFPHSSHWNTGFCQDVQ